MFWTALFILSGVGILAITLAKRIEIKSPRERRLLLLRAVSRGDARARDLYHKGLHFYSEGKLKFLFLIRKQLPLKGKIYFNKCLAWVREKGEERFGNIRNSRLLKRSDGISEFFKSISEVEKGGGELHDDVYVEEKEEILAYRITPAPKIVEPEPLITAVSTPREKKPRAPRKPRVKKVKIEVIED